MKETVLLIAGSEKNKTGLAELLSSLGCEHLSAVTTGEEARIQAAKQEFDLVILNAPLPGELGHELALQLSNRSTVLFLVKEEIAASISDKVSSRGIMVLAKPLQKSLLQQAVQLALSSRRRESALREENLRLQNKISEMKLINRAKCVLIQYLKLTEEQAHHYIEKQAMDLRCKKAQVAETILTMYE